MKKVVSQLALFGILLFSYHHLAKPAAKAGYHGARKTVHVAKRVVL